MALGATHLPWPAKAADLVFAKRLGKGYFGEVWECKRAVATGDQQVDKKPIAVKKVPLSILKQHHLTDQMDREIGILRSLRHPFIVQLHFDFRDDSHVYLGMEFAEGGGMFDLLSKSGKFSNEIAAQYFYEVCDALEYLHTLPEKIIHRDIKPENILLDKEGHVKLADFGWSNYMEKNAGSRATFCGTPDYLAPEMIRGEGHNESLDMWEMGVLLYEMTVGKSPFGASSQEATCRLILRCELRFPSGMNPDAQDLITNLCKLRPEERLTASQAKRHAFVTKFYGRPTEVVKEETLHRPSVEARALRQNKGKLESELNELLQDLVSKDRELQKEKLSREAAEQRLNELKDTLEGEMMQILQAKCATEQKLLSVSEELAEKHKELQQEQRLREAAEQRYTKLKEREELLAAEVVRLKGAVR
mmetsp:Transcript_120833/g.337169  ORF Transcript_120833/g.337169 Transcript_120833/m.337169 type:complete len:419 (-) Transcript_120833:42-1298(-)